MSQNQWLKSSFSSSGENCVEVRRTDALLELRESDEGETILRTNPTAFAALLHGLKSGEFDHHA
ncbi:DUF397 domain-containing protein [Kitasatospora sp. NPDC096128]|uniref:DUF397 domain-containing protein n=1 Tax=Kitasatospora sp. NPDC096128 TaxID=3155547 RepID=UPI00331D01C3